MLKIARQLMDDEVAISELATSVALDAALASEVLKLANSAAFSPVTPVTRLDQGIKMMGLSAFRSLVMKSAVSDLMPSTEVATAGQIRRRTIVNATLSRAFATEIDPDIAEDAFLAGMLGSLGHLVLARKAPEVHKHLQEMSDGWPLPIHEESVLGYCVDDETGDLLSSSAMLDHLYEAIILRSEIRQDWVPKVADSKLVTALRLGLLAERVLCASEENAAVPLRDLLDVGRDILGLELVRLSEILVDTEPLVAELARSLQFEVPDVGEYKAVLAEALAASNP
ncbi:MAG: HD-like signal output (HDOD) protein [Acidimicrobiales bacterium]